jgi:RNA recognition motif-containing protein
MSTNAAETVAAAAPEAVETVTVALNDVSIAPKIELSEADAAHAASAAEGRRLYIGNLAYSTTEEQLKEFFRGFSM